MKRNFPNFLDAYCAYANDNFCPDSFHQWTGISIVSGALERKVWLNEGHIVHYPNTFILLVAHPGTGKSTAITRGTSLLEKLKAEKNHDFKTMSGLMTQAGLCSEMNALSVFTLGSVTTQFSSGYYYASEASDSGLQNLHGDFNATVTALYDCADAYRKRLKQEIYDIPNPSLCILAGSTFDFLKNLVNQNSVMGGLASRFLYVISEERNLQDPIWLRAPKEIDPDMRDKLFQDLHHIHRLAGKFSIKREVVDVFGAWWNRYKEKYLDLASERMESIHTRKPTALKKIAMIVSASERDDLVITGDHMKRAIELVDAVTKDNAKIISSAIIANKNNQDSINQFMFRTLHNAGGRMRMQEFKGALLTYGLDPSRYEPTINFMYSSGALANDSSDPSYVKLLVDPDRYL